MLTLYFGASLAFLLIIVLAWHIISPRLSPFFYSAGNKHTLRTLPSRGKKNHLNLDLYLREASGSSEKVFFPRFFVLETWNVHLCVSWILLWRLGRINVHLCHCWPPDGLTFILPSHTKIHRTHTSRWTNGQPFVPSGFFEKHVWLGLWHTKFNSLLRLELASFQLKYKRCKSTKDVKYKRCNIKRVRSTLVHWERGMNRIEYNFG